MNIEELRRYCLSKKSVVEGFPFDETTLVFKVEKKMFLLTNIEGDFMINVKCEPEKAIDFRERYPNKISPGYHMNKRLWNTVIIDGFFDDDVIKQWVDDSYDLVVASLTKKEKKQIFESI